MIIQVFLVFLNFVSLFFALKFKIPFQNDDEMFRKNFEIKHYDRDLKKYEIYEVRNFD